MFGARPVTTTATRYVVGFPGVADEDLVVQIITEVGRRARLAQLDGLGHPVQIEARFGDDLQSLTDHADLPTRTRAAGAVARAIAPVLDEQRAFNQALVDALHQADHRARWQDERIRRLEREVDELRARLDQA